MVLKFLFNKVFILLTNIIYKMNCELCGKETEELFLASVEGTEISVCTNCTGFGKVIKKIRIGIPIHKKIIKPIILAQVEPSLVLATGFSMLTKSKREQLGLSQKDFALKINEKMSLVHNIESGHFEPGIELARKIEHFLKIKIIEEYKEEKEEKKENRSNEFTIGDMIKIKKL